MTPQEAFNQLSYYTLSRNSEAFIHQYIVDTFTAQTADENTILIKIAFALIGLYLHLEKGFTGKEVQKAHMQLAKYKDKLPTFTLPENRGEITVFDVLNSLEGDEWDKRIEDWMYSVWNVYSSERIKIVTFLERHLVWKSN